MGEERLFQRVGAAVLVVLVVAVGGVIALGGRHIIPGFRVHVEMERSGAIQEGTPVRLAGRQIGEVQAIHMSKTGVVVDLWIRRSWRRHLYRSSEFFVNQASVFGEAYVEVGPPRAEPGPVLEDGAVVRGADPPRLDRLLQKSYENLVAVTTFVKDGMPEAEELGRALTDLQKTLAAVEPDAGAYARTWAAGARFFEEGSLALDALRRSGATVEEVRRTVATARTLFRRSRAELATVATRLDAVAGHIGRLQTRLTPERLARFGQAFDRARQLLAEVDLLLAEAEAVLALVERGEGTVGAFLRDEEWADDWKQLMKVMKTRPWTTVGHPP